jgi:hypothetical protein
LALRHPLINRPWIFQVTEDAKREAETVKEDVKEQARAAKEKVSGRE